jgi:hypothetical protein
MEGVGGERRGCYDILWTVGLGERGLSFVCVA